MKFSKEAIEEAAKLSKMSVGDYLDKLPSSFYEEAAKQSGFSNQEYLGKLIQFANKLSEIKLIFMVDFTIMRKSKDLMKIQQ